MNTPTLKMLYIADIHYTNSDNASREGENLYTDEADKRVLVTSMSQGYRITEGALIVRALDKEEIVSAISEREAFWNTLKDSSEPFEFSVQGAKKTLSPDSILRAWEAIFVKNGKVKAPKYKGITGYRRNGILHLVNAYRHMEKLEAVDTIPCETRVFLDKLEEISANIQENERKAEGTLKTGYVAKLSAARIMYRNRGTQAGMREAFKDGVGQKLFAICDLDGNNTDIGIIDGLLASPDKIVACNAAKMRELQRTGTPETVEAYFTDPAAGRTNTPKMASKKAIALCLQNADTIVKMTVAAILTNDLEALDLLNKDAKARNDHFGNIVSEIDRGKISALITKAGTL